MLSVSSITARTPPAPATRGLVATAAVLTAIASNARRFPGTDFGVYYRAGRHFLRADDLYRDCIGFARYRYAPGLGALFSPLALLGEHAAKSVWLALSIAFALTASAWLLRAAHSSRWWAVPLAWLCLFHPLAQELQLGQVHLAVMALLVGGFVLEDRGQPGGAGALIALATALKVTPALLLVDAILRRRWRVLAGFSVGTGALIGFAVVRYGLSGAVAQHVAWFETQRALTMALAPEPMNQSTVALARAWGGGAPGMVAASFGVALAALSAPGLKLRRSLCLLAIVLASPNGWVQGFVLAAPLVAYLLAASTPLAIVGGALALGTGLLAYDTLGPVGEAWALQHRLVSVDVLVLFVIARLAGAQRPRVEAAVEATRDEARREPGES